MIKIFLAITLLNTFGFAYAEPFVSENFARQGYKKLNGYECAYLKIPDDEENRNLNDHLDLAISEGLVIRDRPDRKGKVLAIPSPMVAAAFNSISHNDYMYIIDDAGYEGWIRKSLVVPFNEGNKAGYDIGKRMRCFVVYRKYPFPDDTKDIEFQIWSE